MSWSNPYDRAIEDWSATTIGLAHGVAAARADQDRAAQQAADLATLDNDLDRLLAAYGRLEALDA